ncbi:hypothetical protein IQ277_04060 [Nostocales cyanobacterium LEGE 12452]|nr:hypothetical protein [Nostocales cyanobacterium LEGE 12452]
MKTFTAIAKRDPDTKFYSMLAMSLARPTEALGGLQKLLTQTLFSKSSAATDAYC